MPDAMALTPRKWPLREAMVAAERILSGDLPVLEGCIRLSALCHEIVPGWTADPDFVVFGAVASEIVHLPFGEVRARWNAAALARADAEAARFTETVRDQVTAACRHILERFADVHTHP